MAENFRAEKASILLSIAVDAAMMHRMAEKDGNRTRILCYFRRRLVVKKTRRDRVPSDFGDNPVGATTRELVGS